MLTLKANYHDGHIDFDPKDLAAVPKEAKVLVVFMTDDAHPDPNSLLAEQATAIRMQSQSSFAQNELLNPLEDIWNHV